MALYPLLPENVEPDRDEKGQIYYIYHAYTDEVPGEQNKDIYFRRDEIFHIPGLGFNGLVGFSPIAMMKNSLGTTLAVEKYGSAFFKNGAQPSGVLEHPGVLKNPEKIRENWSDVYGGPNNAHKVAVLEEGMSGAGRGHVLQGHLSAAGGQPVPLHAPVRRERDLPYLPGTAAHGAGSGARHLLEHRAPEH